MIVVGGTDMFTSVGILNHTDIIKCPAMKNEYCHPDSICERCVSWLCGWVVDQDYSPVNVLMTHHKCNSLFGHLLLSDLSRMETTS